MLLPPKQAAKPSWKESTGAPFLIWLIVLAIVLLVTSCGSGVAPGPKIEPPRPLPVPYEIECDRPGQVKDTPEGGLVFTPDGVDCLNLKLDYFQETRPEFVRRQLREFADSSETIAQSRERLARAEAVEGMIPRWLAIMTAAGGAMLAGGFGYFLGIIGGSI